MPSVRVKRGEYLSLDDVFPDSPTRPRAHSLGTPADRTSAPPQTTTQYTEPPPRSRHPSRRRSKTVSTWEASEGAPGTTNGGSTRRHGRVTEHIMASRRSKRRSSRRYRDSDDTEHLPSRASEIAGAGSDVGTGVVSVHGAREDIVYPGDANHPGRVGSALSLPYSDTDSFDLGDGYAGMHHDDIVEHLDVIDPQVATVSTLTDAANTIVFPPLSFYSRKPVIVLPDVPDSSSVAEKGQGHEDNLDRHVEDCLRKRDKFRRIMRGVWAFMKTPMGIIVSIYGFLIVFWGTGIVVFLIKIINLHNSNTQGFWVELCQQVETGLFTATSIGLIPFRALDTWRIYWIWKYQKLTIKRRQEAGLPALYDNNDLPDPYYDRNYVRVLTDQEQEDLHYQQHKFMQSMTWYRPHGTFTHRAFPIHLALWICIMNDLNSFFQILLSACMWSMDRFQRPAWTTATTLPAAFVAGILAGVFIWQGSKKTRRHQQVEARLRAALALESTTSLQSSGSDRSRGSQTVVSTNAQTTANSTPTLKNPLSPVAKSKDFAMSEMDVGLKGKSVMRSEPPEVASWANEEFDPVSLTADERPYEVAYPPSRPRDTNPFSPTRPRENSFAPTIADEMTVPRDIGALQYQ